MLVFEGRLVLDVDEDGELGLVGKEVRGRGVVSARSSKGGGVLGLLGVNCEGRRNGARVVRFSFFPVSFAFSSPWWLGKGVTNALVLGVAVVLREQYLSPPTEQLR